MNYKFLSACVAALMVFTACEDVPAPYTINSEGSSDSQTLLNESFASSLGKFANFTTDGGVAWKNSYSCATATGYDNSTKTTTDGTAYLVGPAVDLTNADSAYVTYEYILRFNRSQDYQKLLIAEDFVPNANTVASQAWETLIANHTEGSDYTTFYTATAQIPQKYMGKKVRLALYFKCETNSSTWEVKNLKVMKGQAKEATPDIPTPTDDNVLPYTSSSLKDGFTVVTETGTAWSLGNSYAKATGYANSVTTPTVSWLISPAINTTKAEGNDEPVVVDFDYVLRYVGAGTDVKAYHKLYASTDFDGDVTKATWTDLGFEAVESATKDWTFYAAPTLTLPAALVGQEKVYFAFRFECNAENSTTWELKNFKVHQGGSTTPDNPDVPEPSGDNLIANGTFEAWSGGEPVYWKSASTASSATLSQSNESHSGSYSVVVEGTSASNKRLAYKEITLKAGNYNMKFYAKAATSAGGSVRPGYVPIEGGKVGNYAYGDYVNNLTTGEWTEVNHSFSLSGETTLCLVIMNPKNPGANVLIDDVELTTSDGGLADGSGDEPGDEPGGDTGDASIPYNINFTSSTEGWTINDIDLGGLNFVWKQDKTYGMKASAFYNNTNNAAESDFISSEFTIPASGATLSINHALNFLKGNPREEFVAVEVICDNTTEELALSAWPAGTNYTYVDATADLAKYAGKTIKIVFHYKSTDSCAPTWEIKTLSIQ
ncbi:MAG: choice-of-anchor J domain-containing protein [Bacteroidaceae bacterium]|nr:choice-of-anchor J domain-containing protein [Bacteroidaceae bacterium]